VIRGDLLKIVQQKNSVGKTYKSIIYRVFQKELYNFESL